MGQSWSKALPSFLAARLEGRPQLQKVIFNTGWLFIDRVLRLGLGLLIGIWVARYLGPEQFGTYSYAIAFVALFGALANLGLDGIVIRDLVRDPSATREVLGTAFALKLISGTLTVLLSIAAINVIRPMNDQSHWLVSIIAIGTIFQAFDTIDFWFQSKVQSKYAIYPKQLAFLIFSVVKVALIEMQAPLVAFAWAAVGEIVLGAVGLVISYRWHSLHLGYWGASLSRARTMLMDCWALALTGVAIAIYMKIDQVIVGSMLGDKAVGIYSAAVKISELWYFVPTVVASSVYPMLVQLYKESEELFYNRLKELMGYFFWGALAIGVITITFSDVIVTSLYGNQYSESAGVLSIHVFSGVIVSMSIIFSQKFLLDGTMVVSLYGTIVGAVANIVLNILLIRINGIYGAALASVISHAVPMVFQTVVFDRRIGLTFVQSIGCVVKGRRAASRVPG